MNKKEIAAGLRQEVGELEIAIEKLQERYKRLRKFVLDLEAEISGVDMQNKAPVPKTNFRKAIDRVFGEESKRPRH